MFKNNLLDLCEFGCGNGFFLEAWRHMRPEGSAIGFDFSSSRVELCKSKGLSAFEHNLALPNASLVSNSFDCIFCNQVIEHIDNNGQCVLFSEAYRLLRPKGQFIVMSPCRHWEPGRFQDGHINCITPSELSKKLEQVGFTDIDLSINKPIPLDGVPNELLHGFFNSFLPDQLSMSAHAIAFKG
jgi:SAM-dependent methyltransferase